MTYLRFYTVNMGGETSKKEGTRKWKVWETERMPKEAQLFESSLHQSQLCEWAIYQMTPASSLPGAPQAAETSFPFQSLSKLHNNEWK
jgi:hypothetical protein